MRIFLYVSFLALSFLAVSPICAQVLEDERIQELATVRVIQPNVGVQENVSVIQQVGGQNSATIFQIPQDIQAGNFAQIMQNGNLNTSVLRQFGYNLNTVSIQTGNNNQGTIRSVGENINISTTQRGNENSITADVENLGIFTRTVLLEQSGNRNEINLDFLNGSTLGSSNESVRISQRGNQQQLNLSLDNAAGPVEISQTPGIDGQGMQVNVVTSVFPQK
ncbi:hypothetical protein MM236_10235 [Belliella sp. DSM 107340]|uniref:Curlin associated repeat-containing protein n=1 Tax=Belliella calami TaxID=2923436 RepID=A0ABS9UPL0_9BACT|nr:hypothetical protein [Belliella calami]MCH7398370.1 hypothetical protein [Belliella calami]